jgi:4-amino-4-deoxy-L-arabinose transferase-like glycosyltransferase
MKKTKLGGGTANLSVLARPWIASIVVFSISLGVLCGITVLWGTSKNFDGGGDAYQYLGIARSLAEGRGFKSPVGPWPNLPTNARMPGWPVVLAIALRIAPGVPPEAVSRFANVFCLALAGTFFSVLTRRLGVRAELSILAGLAISLSPSLAYLTVLGLSEVSFVLVVALGITLLFTGGRWMYAGFLVLGVGPLIRTNFVLFPFALLGLALLAPTTRHLFVTRRIVFRSALACMLMLAPTLLWAVRNYTTTGRFPLLSTIEGETLYGANNEVVANDLMNWGYWIMPDEIPGESPKLKLAKTFPSELTLNDYYHQKAMTWIKQNPSAVPRLILGKFVRAFAPVPWKPQVLSFIAFFGRFLLYVIALLLLPYWWWSIDRKYILFLGSMIIVHLVTTVIYYGEFRFTHCFVEIFFVPCIFLGLQNWLAVRHQTAKRIFQRAAP